MRILVPLAGVIDLAAERARLGKVAQRLEKDLSKSQAKLANGQFRANAPTDIVAKEEARVADFKQSLERLGEQLRRLQELE
jgi:valyl-tRNA synthetase